MRLRRVGKVAFWGLILLLTIIIARLSYVSHQYKSRPVEITDLSDGGYTPEGVYGHGDLIVAEGTQASWLIYDLPAEDGLVRKVCANGTVPDTKADIDFIYANGEWYKLRSGTGTLDRRDFTAVPEVHKWKGLISSKVTFPVRKPDLPYRAKVIWGKFWNGNISPLEYLEDLKRSNPSCTDMPAP